MMVYRTNELRIFSGLWSALKVTRKKTNIDQITCHPCSHRHFPLHVVIVQKNKIKKLMDPLPFLNSTHSLYFFIVKQKKMQNHSLQFRLRISSIFFLAQCKLMRWIIWLKRNIEISEGRASPRPVCLAYLPAIFVSFCFGRVHGLFNQIGNHH